MHDILAQLCLWCPIKVSVVKNIDENSVFYNEPFQEAHFGFLSSVSTTRAGLLWYSIYVCATHTTATLTST